MQNAFGFLMSEISLQLFRAITGRLFTKEQIESITQHSVGKLLSDFFPQDEDKKDAVQRVKDAENHIEKASEIVLEIQNVIKARSEMLKGMIKDIEEKKEQINHYNNVASASEAQISAIKLELEKAIRKELLEQANQNRRLRQIASIIIWLVTLVAGAALGAYFTVIVDYIAGIIR